MKPKWYLLIVTVVLIQLSGVHSQPPTPAPPEIFFKHFLYGYPLEHPADQRPNHPGLLRPEHQRRHEIRRLGLLLSDAG